MSAVASVSTPGVLPTQTPRAVQAGDVDVVEADREVAHDLQPRGGVEQSGVDAVGQERHEAVAVLHPRPQLVVRRRELIGPEIDVARGADGVQAFLGNAPGNEYVGPVHGNVVPVRAWGRF